MLAQWDGLADAWEVVARNQFTEVTGPGGIYGNPNPETDPLWTIGWDHRSLILMCLDRGQRHRFRLPKSSHSYDGAHGWNTDWPRIRDIGEEALLMTMHGAFWTFPKTFQARNTAGIAPRSNYLKVIGDFTRWTIKPGDPAGDRIVFGCDDTAKNEFLCSMMHRCSTSTMPDFAGDYRVAMLRWTKTLAGGQRGWVRQGSRRGHSQSPYT